MGRLPQAPPPSHNYSQILCLSLSLLGRLERCLRVFYLFRPYHFSGTSAAPPPRAKVTEKADLVQSVYHISSIVENINSKINFYIN